jgi:hypothetical protein
MCRAPVQTLTATQFNQENRCIWYDAATGGNVVSDPSLNLKKLEPLHIMLSQ